MTKNIFDIEVRLDIDKEFKKMANYLYQRSYTSRASTDKKVLLEQ